MNYNVRQEIKEGQGVDTPNRRSKKKKWSKLILIVFSTVIILIASGFIYEFIASQQAKDKYPAPGKMVDVGGFSLHVNKIGTASPTIILENGSGETSLSWGDIPQQLAEHATVVTYDRAGYAWSEASDAERSGENIVKELHTALHNEGITGPYIVVGHSLGGMYARLFAQTYRDEVQGLVLVDARPENDANNTAEIYEKENVQGTPSSGVIKLMKQSGILRLFQNVLLEGIIEPDKREEFINVTSSPSFFDAKDEEGLLAHTTEDSIRGQDLGNLPVKVIARGIAPDYAGSGISQQAGEQIEQIWSNGQKEMLSISSQAEYILAEQSGHYVMWDQPELIINVITDLIAELQELR